MTRAATTVLALAAIGTLAGCGSRTAETAGKAARMVNPMTYARLAAQSAGHMASFVANTTSTSSAASAGHGQGTQIEYLAADGDAYLIAPGSETVEVGRWETRSAPDSQSGTEICLRYANAVRTGSIRPNTNGWDCTDALRWLLDHDEIREGDPMKLESTKSAPAPLPASTDLSISDGLSLWHVDTALAPNKATWGEAN